MASRDQDRDARQAGKTLKAGYCEEMNKPYVVVAIHARVCRILALFCDL